MKFYLYLLLTFFLSLSYACPPIPDASISPGHMCTLKDKDYKELRYAEKIPYCKRNVSNSLKTKIYRTYKIEEKDRKNYTIDHIIPLSIGGSNDIKNLWPEHYLVKNTRKNLEYKLYLDLKNNKINQKEAVRIILKEKFKN
jgi:hypothetical protein